MPHRRPRKPRDLDAYGFLRAVSLIEDKVSSFDEYPFSIPAVRKLGTLDLDPKVTFLVGENGSGKSTLAEARTSTLPPGVPSRASRAAFVVSGTASSYERRVALDEKRKAIAAVYRLVQGERSGGQVGVWVGVDGSKGLAS